MPDEASSHSTSHLSKAMTTKPGLYFVYNVMYLFSFYCNLRSKCLTVFDDISVLTFQDPTTVNMTSAVSASLGVYYIYH